MLMSHYHTAPAGGLARLRMALATLALALTAGLGQANALAPTVPLTDLEPGVEHRRATRLITHFLANYHYKKTQLTDELSAQVFERYIDGLDPTRSYFTQTDIESFSRHEQRLDDYLRQADLIPIFQIFKRYRTRLEDRVDYALSLLDTPFDFERDERYVFKRDEAPWPENEAELDEIWRKRVKNDVLSLRLAGKEEDEIRDTLEKRYEGLERRTAQLGSEDVFQMFINAYTTTIDPHTAYFSPRTSENFKIRMSLSLEGIGAVLQSEDEYTVVRQVVAGGPAAKSKLVAAEDRIVGVGQGDEDVVNVIGWRLDDVVDLIRGPKGSVVTLEVLPKEVGVDGPSKTIKLTRNTIKLEEQAAKSSVIEVGDDRNAVKVGVIDLPAFYLDFDARARGDRDYRSTTRDVRRLIEALKTEDIAGIIMDLRGNGGGSLTEATELTGLFIDRGPVVQVRNSQGRVQLEEDTDSGVAYDGPLMVLVDRNSASASEIFAGAVQDYRRGLVVGEPTFGKGTVQHLVDLNRFDKSMDGQLGQLKATIAQFFRVEGASTQHKGVVPDIVFPTAQSTEDHGERALDNALPWARIDAARFVPADQVEGTIDRLKRRHEARVATDEAFEALKEQELAVEEAAAKDSLSLVESVRKEELEKAKREQRARENRIREARGLPPLTDEDETTTDDATAATGETDDETVADAEDGSEEDDELDILLREAANILADFVRVSTGAGETPTLVGVGSSSGGQADEDIADTTP